jgi:hypothetical protein
MRDMDPDRFRLARINGAAGHYAHLRQLSGEQETQALASITSAAAGRADLLAHAAGILLGFHEGTTGESRARSTAELFIKAGADQHQIARWTDEGRRRAQAVTGKDRW